MKRKNPQTIGARRKQESVVRAAEARRERRAAAGAPAVQPKTAEQLDAEARGLLRQHKIRESPASIRLAKLHCQSTDAVDALYDICVTRGKEPRLVSAMVSAGKLAVDVWDPRTSSGGRVDYKAIRAHLEHLLGSVPPRFPSLLELAIDVSLLQDAEELADWCRRQPWGGRVRAFRADRLTNQLMWQHLEQRVLSGRDKIELLPHKRMLDELKAARVRIGETGLAKVVDSVRGDRRGRLHRDVAMALAGCCYLAAKYATASIGGTVAKRINESIRLTSKFKPIVGADIGKARW